jgi:peptidoglycan hydrolase-like protein with peptidoglycan-binding domain
MSGKAERRWMQPSGELMEQQPGLGFVAAQLGKLGQFLGADGTAGTSTRRGGRRPASSGLVTRNGLLGSLDRNGQFQKRGDMDAGPETVPTAPPVLSDDVDARASEARRMLQQATPFWEREENKALKQAAETGPRAGEAGYAQRADIQAWMDAQRAKGPAGEAMVNRFIEQQKKRGLYEAPVATPQVDQLATSPDAQMAAERGYGEAGVDASALSGMKLENTRPMVDERFQNPAFGTEVLRGMPATLATALTPDRDARQAIEADYSGGATPGAFVDNATLPNTAFVGNGMSAEPTLTPGREQDVPGITSPFVEPQEIRDLNLNGANALVRRHLNLIQGR